MKELRIYIHIPFCKSKCQYCDFNSYADKDYLMDSYIEAVCREIELYYSQIKDCKITSIFLGGGTPSYLKSNLIKKVLSYFDFDEQCEVSIEINPGTVNREKLVAYQQMGINRLSFGVQSMNDKLLRLMGRVHNKETAVENIKLAKEIGFTNISADLIFGYPLQAMDMYKQTLKEMVALDLQHMSCYSLKIEKGTPLHSMMQKKMLPEIDDQLDRDMYHYTNKYLKSMGIKQYEISNYARKGYECKHNVGYWKLDDYLGIGISAHSYFNGERFNNTENIVEYIRGIKNNQFMIVDRQPIDVEESKKEYIILGLRLTKGILITEYDIKYNSDFILEYADAIAYCQENQYLSIKGDHIKLTEKGKDFSNDVFTHFI